MGIKKKKNFLILLLSLCCCFIVSGYFVLINSLVIQGNVKVNSAVWEVKFTDIKTSTLIGKAQNYQLPKFNNYAVHFFAEFESAGDAVVYDVEIANQGTLHAQLSSILFLADDQDYLTFEVIGLDTNDVLKSGETRKFQVKISYNGQLTEAVEEKQAKLVLNWKQYEK